MLTAAEVHGTVPQLQGERCEALICEQYCFHDRLESSANVVFLRVGATWHRLAVDHPAIFWRPQSETPQPWSVPEKGWSYPHVNVGELAALQGRVIEEVTMQSTDVETTVEIALQGDRIFRLVGTRSSSRYEVV